MSAPLPPTSSPVTDSEDDAESALLFARCSPAQTDAAASRSSAAGLHKDNFSQSNRHLIISLGASLLIALLLLFVARWFYLEKIEPRLTTATAATASAAASNHAAPATPASSGAALNEELAKSAEQISALQKLVDVMRREQLLMQQNTRESLENISATLKIPNIVSAPETSVTDQPGIPRMADVKPQVTPTQQEFLQLKERNRLTQYADEAIATGMRRPIELLVEYMRDPQLPHLHEAAQAEFMRAIRAIQLLQREDPGYRLPVAELFKDSSIRDEADVTPAALLKLLADYKTSWEVRVRVCFLLLGSPLPETNAQLIKAIKEDPSLDVAKHAQLALEQRIKKRFRIFDIPAIEEWSKSQGK
ncbi:hypothetical protein [Prosthecobacter sp.]|uniref:hypothetical protein n=1 Tax=Prosthecobacter sp. TaxID=1965333 RepID=UPI0024893F73|nr:hypothetical protein [Prosthecobacter sp.]MDI1313667.1 hypothetical protein [Prosthecobacter sp.]